VFIIKLVVCSSGDLGLPSPNPTRSRKIRGSYQGTHNNILKYFPEIIMTDELCLDKKEITV